MLFKPCLVEQGRIMGTQILKVVRDKPPIISCCTGKKTWGNTSRGRSSQPLASLACCLHCQVLGGNATAASGVSTGTQTLSLRWVRGLCARSSLIVEVTSSVTLLTSQTGKCEFPCILMVTICLPQQHCSHCRWDSCS